MIEILNANEPDKRQVTRRTTDHTPNDCFKLLDVQTAMQGVTDRLDKGQLRMDKIDVTIKNLDNKIESNNNDTAEILDIIRASRGFFKVAGWLMKGLGAMLAVAAPVVAIWHTVKDSVHPLK